MLCPIHQHSVHFYLESQNTAWNKFVVSCWTDNFMNVFDYSNNVWTPGQSRRGSDTSHPWIHTFFTFIHFLPWNHNMPLLSRSYIVFWRNYASRKSLKGINNEYSTAPRKIFSSGCLIVWRKCWGYNFKFSTAGKRTMHFFVLSEMLDKHGQFILTIVTGRSRHSPESESFKLPVSFMSHNCHRKYKSSSRVMSASDISRTKPSPCTDCMRLGFAAGAFLVHLKHYVSLFCRLWCPSASSIAVRSLMEGL